MHYQYQANAVSGKKGLLLLFGSSVYYNNVTLIIQSTEGEVLYLFHF